MSLAFSNSREIKLTVATQAVVYLMSLNACHSAKCGQANCIRSRQWNRSIAASIFLLFGLVNPAAIIRFVSSVIVDSIDRVIYWHWTYVSKKIKKVFFPPIANRDAAFTVIFIRVVVWICAASKYFAPAFVFRAESAIPRMSMAFHGA